MRGLLVLAAVGLLAGCASQYIAPTSGPTAKIKFDNGADRPLRIAFFDVSSGCRHRHVNKWIQPNGSATYKVIANRKLTFEYYLSDHNVSPYAEAYCLVNLRFAPKEGDHYLFRTFLDKFRCAWVMFDDTNKTRPKKVRLTQIPWKRGFSENSSFCNK